MKVSLNPLGLSGLKFVAFIVNNISRNGLNPLGLSGLKSRVRPAIEVLKGSQPSWVEWIEINYGKSVDWFVKSQPSWVEWIEILIHPRILQV